MVDAVHVGRDDDPAQNAINACREADIAVVEHGGGVQQHFEDQHSKCGRPEGSDYQELDAHRQCDFDRMEAQSRCHVERKVGVMHAMQAPQRRDRVKGPVLKIDREVERQHRQRYCEPRRQGDRVEKTPAARFGDHGQADRRRWQQETHQHGVEGDEGEVVGPADEPADLLHPARKQRFAGGDESEHGDTEDETDRRFVTEQVVRQTLPPESQECIGRSGATRQHGF